MPQLADLTLDGINKILHLLFSLFSFRFFRQANFEYALYLEFLVQPVMVEVLTVICLIDAPGTIAMLNLIPWLKSLGLLSQQNTGYPILWGGASIRGGAYNRQIQCIMRWTAEKNYWRRKVLIIFKGKNPALCRNSSWFTSAVKTFIGQFFWLSGQKMVFHC